jgi:hypothetical protein
MGLRAGLTAVCVVCATLAPAQAQTDLKWNLRPGDMFFLEAVNTVKNTTKLDGEESKLEMEIATVESYKVLKNDAQGVVLEKTILSQKLKSSLPDLEKSAAAVAKKLEGTMLTISFDAAMQKVTGIDGMKNYMKRLMDDENAPSSRHEEVIKEEQQNIFTGLLPDRPATPGQEWQRTLTHKSPDPAANYNATVTYTFKGKETLAGIPLERIDAVWSVTFVPAKPEIKPDLKADPATATYFFDSAAGRLVKSDRTFHIKGKITTASVGKETVTEIDQDQSWHIRLTNENPLAK